MGKINTTARLRRCLLRPSTSGRHGQTALLYCRSHVRRPLVRSLQRKLARHSHSNSTLATSRSAVE